MFKLFRFVLFFVILTLNQSCSNDENNSKEVKQIEKSTSIQKREVVKKLLKRNVTGKEETKIRSSLLKEDNVIETSLFYQYAYYAVEKNEQILVIRMKIHYVRAGMGALYAPSGASEGEIYLCHIYQQFIKCSNAITRKFPNIDQLWFSMFHESDETDKYGNSIGKVEKTFFALSMTRDMALNLNTKFALEQLKLNGPKGLDKYITYINGEL